jgi:hypothetical protein
MWGRTQGGAPIPLQEQAIFIKPSKDGRVFAITSEGTPLRGNKTDKEGVRVRESHYAYCPRAAEIKAEVKRRLAAKKKKRDDGPHPNAPKERRVNACDKCGCPLEFVHVGGRFRGGPEEGRMVGGRWVAVEPGEVSALKVAPDVLPWQGLAVQIVVEGNAEDEPVVVVGQLCEPQEVETCKDGWVGRQIHRCGGGL